jgi:hypothetical protein
MIFTQRRSLALALQKTLRLCPTSEIVCSITFALWGDCGLQLREYPSLPPPPFCSDIFLREVNGLIDSTHPRLPEEMQRRPENKTTHDCFKMQIAGPNKKTTLPEDPSS